MYYFGQLKGTVNREVFYSDHAPTREVYGHVYSYVTGGYKLKSEAMHAAYYTGFGLVTYVNFRKVTLDN
jgi:hypothetical protein